MRLELTLRKIPFTVDSENRLRMLKARTGLDRNYLCRIGYCLSLEEPGVPAIPAENLRGGREIDRYTLLGHCAPAFIALLLVWMNDKRIYPGTSADMDNLLVGHMNRGVEIIASRVKSLADLALLLPSKLSDVVTDSTDDQS